MSPDIADWLRAEGFDPDAPDRPGRHGNTPLMHAAWRGRADVVEALLARGVAFDTANGDGNTALWLACVHGAPALIERLVRAGAAPAAGSGSGAAGPRSMGSLCTMKPRPLQCTHDSENTSMSPDPTRLRVIWTRPSEVTSAT